MRIEQNFRQERKLELNRLSNQEVTEVSIDTAKIVPVDVVEQSMVQPIEISTTGIYPTEVSHSESILKNYQAQKINTDLANICQGSQCDISASVFSETRVRAEGGRSCQGSPCHGDDQGSLRMYSRPELRLFTSDRRQHIVLLEGVEKERKSHTIPLILAHIKVKFNYQGYGLFC